MLTSADKVIKKDGLLFLMFVRPVPSYVQVNKKALMFVGITMYNPNFVVVHIFCRWAKGVDHNCYPVWEVFFGFSYFTKD